MSGCYGNNPEDKHFEAKLHKWEDSQFEDEVDDESRDMRREREESDTL